jgi:hypothetical protein
MSTTIQIKRSSTASAVPLSGDLAVGELAVNLADKRLFAKQADGTIIELSTNPTDLDAATLRIDGVEITASATELNSLDGLTATTAELNTLDGVTATATELNKLDGFTGSTAELNLLDGVTATTAELNVLDGITATTTELNYTDGVTSSIQTQLNGKATSAQGALADSAVQTDDNVSFGTGSFSGEIAANGGIALGDNDKATFGASDDLQIYHDGSDSYITDANGLGNLILRGSANVQIEGANGENCAIFNENGSVRLFNDNAEKLATKSTGVNVTGNIESDSVTIGLGAVAGTEKLRVNGTVLTLGGTEAIPAIGVGDINTGIYAPTAGTLGWTVNGSQRLLLNSTGVDVTGTVTADGLSVDGNAHIVGSGTGNDTEGARLLIGKGTGDNTPRITTWQESADNDVQGMRFYTKSAGISSSPSKLALSLKANNDIHFFENTGTTAKFVWDASAESLGIGTASPETTLEIAKGDRANGTIFSITNTLSDSSWGSGDVIGGIDFRTDDASASHRVRAGIQAVVSGGTSTYPDEVSLAFSTADGQNAATEAMRIHSSGNVGIGTDSPSDELHIKANSHPRLRIDAGLSGEKSNLLFINSADGTYAQIENEGSALKFLTQATERARIDSSGNLLVGTTSTSWLTGAGHRVFNNGSTTSTVANGTVGSFNRLYSDGEIVNFRRSGTAVGSIGSVIGQYLRIGSSDTGIMFQDGTSSIEPRAETSNNDGAINLGAASNRFKHLYLSGGVYLGGTGAANKLDDYETGTFSLAPGVSGIRGTTTNPTYTISRDANQYIKIGDYVTLYIDTWISGLSSEGAGSLYLVPPFTSASTGAGGEYYGAVAYSVNFDVEPYGYFIDNGLARIYLTERNGAILNTSALSSTTRFRFSVTYRAA